MLLHLESSQSLKLDGLGKLVPRTDSQMEVENAGKNRIVLELLLVRTIQR